MNVLEFTLHKTTPEYRAGLLKVFEHGLTSLETCMLRLPFMKAEFLQIINQFVHRFETKYDSEEYKLGLYAASGWFQHALHSVHDVHDQDATQLIENVHAIIQGIEKLSS